MNDMFTVTLTGTLLNGTPQEKALDAFARICKLSQDDAAKTFARSPVVLKRNVDEKMARAISRMLTDAGLGHTIDNAAKKIVDGMFTVKLTGTLLNGTPQEKALGAFAKICKLSLEDAAQTFAKAPVILKRNVDEKMARAISRMLTDAGLGHTIDNAAARVATPLETPAEKAILPVAAQRELKPATGPSGTEVASGGATFEPATPKGFAFRIEGKPDYAFLTVKILANETVKVEASAMATMDTHIKMKTKLKGGLGRMLSGENIFMNEFTAQNAPGEIGIAPAAPGDLMHQYLDGNTIYLQNSAFVACSMGVAVETKWQGLVKGFFSSEGLFLIRCSGKGDLWFNTYGASIEIDVTGDYVVDTGNIVAFTEGLEYRITKMGGYKSLFFSGEGFVCRFSGKGKVWIQTRTTGAFVSWANWFRPTKSG